MEIVIKTRTLLALLNKAHEIESEMNFLTEAIGAPSAEELIKKIERVLVNKEPLIFKSGILGSLTVGDWDTTFEIKDEGVLDYLDIIGKLIPSLVQSMTAYVVIQKQFTFLGQRFAKKYKLNSEE